MKIIRIFFFSSPVPSIYAHSLHSTSQVTFEHTPKHQIGKAIQQNSQKTQKHEQSPENSSHPAPDITEKCAANGKTNENLNEKHALDVRRESDAHTHTL